MIRSFVEAMLGEFGRQILYFYEANAFIFNAIILSYGLFMLLAWNNLVRIYRYLIIEIAKSAHLSDEINRKKSNKKIRNIIGVPWEKAVEASPFPFVARMGALVPRKKSVEILQVLFDEKDLVDKALKALQGERVQRMMPSYRLMQQREMDHRKEKKEAREAQKN